MYAILPAEENPALRSISREISVNDIGSKKIRTLIAEMKTLLSKEDHGVALAAVQVGEPVRLFIVSGRALARGKRTSPDEDGSETLKPTKKIARVNDEVFLNPTLLKLSRGKVLKHEGCLSIRGKWGEVPRAEKAVLSYLDEAGKRHERGASGFLAHIFQHEMDHLEGVLYIDKAEKLYEEHDKKD